MNFSSFGLQNNHPGVVEATKMKGEGDLVLTGQLGDVMKESATLALSWIRSNSKKV